MDIQTENELIQEAFEIEADEIGFCLDKKWGDYETPYENSETALAFNLFKKGWKAQKVAVPEGFVVVPKVPTEELLSKAIRKYLEVSDLSMITNRMFHLYELMIQEAMIEAQEKTND